MARGRMAELRYRAADVEPSEGGVRVTVSSETPCPGRVFDEDECRWVDALEVLGHGDGEIDFSRCAEGLVIQDRHDGDQIGLMRSPSVENGKLGGVVTFCAGQRAKEIEQDAAAGLRRNMSVGYTVERWARVSDGLYRAVRWTPHEASFVSVPADATVGVGRCMGVSREGMADEPAAEERKTRMADTIVEPAAVSAVPDYDIKGALEGIMTELRAMRQPPAKPDMPVPSRGVVFGEREGAEVSRRYSLMNAIRAMNGDSVDAGYEREVSREIELRTGRRAQGLLIPDTALAVRTASTDTLSKNADGASNGAKLVATDTLFGEFIPALTAATVLGSVGVRTLTGLVGDISVPKGSAATAYWVSAEGGDATGTLPSVSQVTGTPHTVGAYTDITRRLLNQSGISVENYVAESIRNAVARAVETAVFEGSGSSGQPTGMSSASGVNAPTIASAGTVTLAELLDFVSLVDADNASSDNQCFIGSPAVWKLLRGSTESTYIGDFLVGRDGYTATGHRFVKSNLCGAKKLYFGDWSQILLAFWGGVDLTVDRGALSKSGGVRVVALQDMDVMVRNPVAFSVATVLS